MTKQTYEDYKYVMQDTYQLYLGARYSYREIIENEEIPFKFRLVVERYIYQDVDPETTLESHLYYMSEKNIVFTTYKHIKMKVKISILEEKKSFTGRVKKTYATQILPLEQLMQMSPAEKEQKGVMIQEVICSKLALLTF